MASSKTSSVTAEQPVGFLDSGIGGLPYLERARELLPGERFVYLADREHFPYGVRPRDEIREIVIGAVSKLVNAVHPKMVVVACNTASVVSLSELRSTFSMPFVGVVPAIKPAGEAAPGGRIGVLATERTVEDPYLSGLVGKFAPHSGLVLVPAGNLVRIIETRLAVGPRSAITTALRAAAERLLSESVDVVVLGCTHFIHIRHELSELMGPEIPVFDSVDGVARQIVRVCGQGRSTTGSSLPSATADRDDQTRDLLLVTGGDPGENYRKLASQYNLKLVAHESGG